MNRSLRNVAVGLVGLALVAPATVQAQDALGLALGSQAPPAAVVDLDGEPLQLLDLVPKGKPALLEFWATWCEQCEALQPQLDRIQAESGSQINVVAVAVGVAQSPRRVKRHVEGHDPGYPYVYDSQGNAVRAYKAATTSIVLMLDAEGTVVYAGVGPDQDLIGAVGEVLAAN